MSNQSKDPFGEYVIETSVFNQWILLGIFFSEFLSNSIDENIDLHRLVSFKNISTIITIHADSRGYYLHVETAPEFLDY